MWMAVLLIQNKIYKLKFCVYFSESWGGRSSRGGSRLGFPAKPRTGTVFISLRFNAKRCIDTEKVLFQLETWVFRMKQGTFSAINLAF